MQLYCTGSASIIQKLLIRTTRAYRIILLASDISHHYFLSDITVYSSLDVYYRYVYLAIFMRETIFLCPLDVIETFYYTPLIVEIICTLLLL